MYRAGVTLAVGPLADKGDFEHPIMELNANAVARRYRRIKDLPTKHGAYQVIGRRRYVM